MKLARMTTGTMAPTLVSPPGHPMPSFEFREQYMDEDSGQVYVLTHGQRDELDPRWRPDGDEPA